MSETMRVDVRAIEERNASVSKGMANLPAWIARWFGESLLFMLGIFFGIPLLIDWFLPATAEFTSRRGVFLLVASVLMAAGSVAFRYRNIRRLISTSPQALEEQTIGNWIYVTGAGWAWRTIRMGLMIAFGVGIPIGLLLAFDTPVQELPANSRIVMMLGFVAMTAAWAIPMAFLLRWLIVRKHRPLIVSQ